MIRRGIGRAGRPGLLGTAARTAVIAGTATAVSGNVARRQQARAQQAPATDVVSQLKDLAALRDSGVLTDDEFAAQKARILGS